MNPASPLSKGFASIFGQKITANSWLEYVIFGTAVLLVCGAIVFWAAVIRKPKKERRYKHSRRPPPQKQSAASSSDKADTSFNGERRRRSSNRRNPTLAEVREARSTSTNDSTATEVYHR